jgi:hypothetical protein
VTRNAARRYLRFLALAGAAAALLAAVGYLPTRNLAGAAGVTAMLVACALCWVASALSALPVAVAEGGGRPPVTVVLGASAVRFAVVLGLTVAAALSGLVAKTPLLVWTALGYLVLLVVDTLYAAAATGAEVPLLGTGAERGAEDGAGGGAQDGAPAGEAVREAAVADTDEREDAAERS